MTWAARLEFSVSMEPVPKARPRVVQGRPSYTPARTAKAERRISTTARDTMMANGVTAAKGPVMLACTFIIPQAKSWPKWKKRARAGVLHTSTPDLDNLFKLVEDALNGVAYQDDRQIVATKAVKLWSTNGEGAVHVTVLEQEDPNG